MCQFPYVLSCFFAVHCSFSMETDLWEFFVAYDEDAFIQTEFAVAFAQLPEATACP